METMMDPCVGTGRFPLHASNYTLRIYGMDINATLIKATLVNGHLYSPWMVRPIPWLDPELTQIGQEDGAMTHPTTAAPSLAARLSDRMMEAAPPQARPYLADTEHDVRAQPGLAPILKRRKKQQADDPSQGSLF